MTLAIRRLIISEFKKTGRLPSPQYVAKKAGIDLDAYWKHMKAASPLPDLGGLSPEQARQLIKKYGDGVMFEASIETSLKRLDTVRDEIKKKEKRFK